MKVLRIGLIIVSLFVTLPIISVAQGDVQVQEIFGQVSPENEFIVFDLPDMQAGTTIYMYAESDTIDTWIGICDLKCEETLVENDDITADNVNSALSYTFEASGSYAIFVTDCCRSEVTGNFRLLLGFNSSDILDGSAVPNGAEIAVPKKTFATGLADTSINNEAQVQEFYGDVNSNTPVVFYDIFDAKAGQTVYLYVESDDIDTKLIVCDIACEEIFAENDDISSDNLNSALAYTFPNDGDYSIAVGDCCSDEAAGNFRILLGYNAPEVLTGTASPIGATIAQVYVPLGSGELVTLTIENQSADVICHVYIVPHTSETWGEDQLDESEDFPPGQALAWELEPNIYDIQLTNCDDNTMREYFTVDLAQSRTVSFSKVSIPQQESTSVAVELITLTVENRSSTTICIAYISKVNYDDWGNNQLDEAEVIEPDTSRHWSLEPDLYDVLLADCNGNILQEIYGVILNESYTLTYYPDDPPKPNTVDGNDFPDPSIVDDLILQGGTLFDAGRYAEALDLYEDALNQARQIDYRWGEGASLYNIGLVYYTQEHYIQALPYFQQAVTVIRQTDDRALEGSILGTTGYAQLYLGQYDQALESLQQAQAVSDQTGDLETQVDVLNSLGLVYEHLGQNARALEHYQQALVIARETDDELYEGTVLHNIGLLYAAQGQYDQAIDHYQQALGIFRKINWQEGTGTALDSIGFAYASQGQFDQALDYHQQALGIAREIDDRSSEAGALFNIGLVYVEQGQYAEAIDHLQQTLNIEREMDHRIGEATTLDAIGGVFFAQGQYDQALDYLQQALVIAREIDDQVGVGNGLGNIGLAYDRQGQYEKAIEFYVQAIEVIENIHADIRLESGQAAFVAKYVGFYSRLVNLLAQSDPTRAFHYAERGRARSFLFQLGNEDLTFREGADSALLDEWQTKQDEVIALRAERVELFSRPSRPTREVLEELDSAISQAELELAQLEDRIAVSNPPHSQLIQVDVPELAELQAGIPENTTLMAYYVVAPSVFDDGQVLAYVLTQDSLEVVPLTPSPEDLSTAIEAFRGDETATAALEQLHAWLITPLTSYLTTSNLVIVPHGVLNYLPFAALTADGTNYLSDEFVISYAPSVSVYKTLQDTRPPAPTSENWLILGNPSPSDDTLPPLPGAQAEAEAVSTIFNTDVYLGQAATEDLLRAQIGQVDGIHISAHGIFNVNNTLSSYLALTPGAEHDGLLEVREIYALPLQEHAPMVVLSACETAVNELAAGDEFQGLTRAFLLSGARVVLASQWAVEDEATAVLMTAFYQNRSAGMSDAEALAAAQRTVRENPEWASPFYWAAFQLVGLAN